MQQYADIKQIMPEQGEKGDWERQHEGGRVPDFGLNYRGEKKEMETRKTTESARERGKNDGRAL